jgi:hypothetical protein
VTTEADIDFSSLPQVDQSAPPVQRRPRFDGDVSELPGRACWALQQLLTFDTSFPDAIPPTAARATRALGASWLRGD